MKIPTRRGYVGLVSGAVCRSWHEVVVSTSTAQSRDTNDGGIRSQPRTGATGQTNAAAVGALYPDVKKRRARHPAVIAWARPADQEDPRTGARARRARSSAG